MDLAVLWPYCAVVLVGLTATLVLRRRGWRWGLYLTKPLASSGFIAVALAAGALDTRYGRIVLLALVLCWTGDLLLISSARRTFLVGLISFLCGHLAYVVAFVDRGLDPLVTGVALAVLSPAALGVGRWLWPHVSTNMRGPVLAYIVVISVMASMATGVSAAAGVPTVAVGAAMFFLSDISVARERFISESFLNRLWGLPLYYGGQVLLAASVAS